MRVYENFNEAKSELARDLKELGVKVSTKTYQNLNTDGNPDLDTYELTNYHYRIEHPDTISAKHPEWAKVEFHERVTNVRNPGEAWKLRKELWSKFLNEDGQFDYTYGDRLFSWWHIVKTLKDDPNSRRAVLNIWDGVDVYRAHRNVRVPCSLYYHFRVQNDRLNMCYVMRSCDFIEHWQNDLWLAKEFLRLISDKLPVDTGYLEHFIHSFHVYQKDVAHVF